MRSRQQRLLLLTFIVGALLAAITAVARAQGGPTIGNAQLMLWPEYDKPGLLVIFNGDFITGTTFPLQVSFPLPANAHDIQATYKDASGALLSQAQQFKNGVLTYTLPGPGFHVEYYVDRPVSGDQRDLSYAFQAPYSIKQLQVEVQQPARATGFSLTPSPESSAPGADGLTYHRLSRANLVAGATLPITMRYSKPDQGTSVTATPQSAAVAGPAPAGGAPATGGSAGGPDVRTILPWLLIGLGVAALVGAAVYLMVQGRRAAMPAASYSSARGRGPAQAGRAAVPPRQAPAPAAPADGAAYCPQCGRRYGPDDAFCAGCGAPRRR